MTEQQVEPQPSPAMRETFARFTGRTRDALLRAQEEAQALNHTSIGTEHLLLGLLAERRSAAVKALAGLGIEPRQVRAAVEEIIGRGDPTPVGEVGLTPRCKVVLELAVDEARRLKRGYVCSEHLLLALIREGESVAAQVLAGFDVTLEKARTEVLQLTGGRMVSAKNNVVMCRLDDASVNALDTLIEAGIRATRSDAAAWLVQQGIEANVPLFGRVSPTVAHIRRLRLEARRLAQEVTVAAASTTQAQAQGPTADDDGERTSPGTT
ncbi:MAG TPA: Clp protease N-terminal domain-containing protein [Chloroflexota bacterium]